MKVRIKEANMKKQKLTDFEKELLENLIGQEMYCVIKSVSKSGLTKRVIFSVQYKNELYCLNRLIAKLTFFKNDKDGYLVVKGGGIDIIFHTLLQLAKEVENE
jgi:hypothetical protein